MNWTHFLLWLAGIYSLYYLVNILLDSMRGGLRGSLQPAAGELTFSEHIVPHEAGHVLDNDHGESAAPRASSRMSAQYSPEVISSGGVLLKDVFSLARKEVIVYTRQVSF